MPILIKCPGCGKHISAPDHLAGHSGKCKSCGSIVEIPVPLDVDPDEEVSAEAE